MEFEPQIDIDGLRHLMAFDGDGWAIGRDGRALMELDGQLMEMDGRSMATGGVDGR